MPQTYRSNVVMPKVGKKWKHLVETKNANGANERCPQCLVLLDAQKEVDPLPPH